MVIDYYHGLRADFTFDLLTVIENASCEPLTKTGVEPGNKS